MIDSCYRQYIKKGGSESFQNYIEPQNLGRFRHRFPGFSLDHFMYLDVIKQIQKEIVNVNVFVYEKEKKTLIQTISKLLKLSYIKENEFLVLFGGTKNISYNNASLFLARLTNRFCATDIICQKSIFQNTIIFTILQKFYFFISLHFKSDEYCFDERYTDIFNSYYALNNSETSKLLRVELSDFGYTTIRKNGKNK